MVDYEKRCSYLESRIKELEEKPISRKEDIIKKIAKEFGEDSHEEKSYQDRGDIKTYNSMTDFCWGLYAMKRVRLLDLLERIRTLNKNNALATESVEDKS